MRMNNAISREDIRESWLELFCFMSSSARGLEGEPAVYGPFRLIDSLEKILAILEQQGLSDKFLQAEKEKISEGKLVLITDKDAFFRFVDELVMDFTRELKKSS
jgi:hypothetical protein